jgi:hypothetical protein
LKYFLDINFEFIIDCLFSRKIKEKYLRSIISLILDYKKCDNDNQNIANDNYKDKDFDSINEVKEKYLKDNYINKFNNYCNKDYFERYIKLIIFQEEEEIDNENNNKNKKEFFIK